MLSKGALLGVSREDGTLLWWLGVLSNQPFQSPGNVEGGSSERLAGSAERMYLG